MKWINKIKENLLDIIFPKFCIGCGKEGTYLCKDCQSCLEVLENTFCLCKKPKMLSLADTGKCQECYPRELDGLYFPLSYQNNFIRELIHQFKYEPFVKELAKPLAELIITHFYLLDKKVWKDKILVPLPLSRKRLRKRGFNQSEEIAKEIARGLNIPLIANCLLKVKETAPQTELPQKARKENIKDAFLIKDSYLIKDKKIFLIDDVYTTGSTLEEAAKVLKQAGAKEVWGVVVAREPLEN